jgi:hypothetical protein
MKGKKKEENNKNKTFNKIIISKFSIFERKRKGQKM